MARGDFPFDRHGLNLRAIVARPRVGGRSRCSIERSQARRSGMQIKATLGVSFPGSVERPPLEDVVVLVDGAGVALGNGGVIHVINPGTAAPTAQPAPTLDT